MVKDGMTGRVGADLVQDVTTDRFCRHLARTVIPRQSILVNWPVRAENPVNRSYRVAALAVGFGPIERRIRIAQKVVRSCTARPRNDDPDAGRHQGLLLPHPDGFRQDR